MSVETLKMDILIMDAMYIYLIYLFLRDEQHVLLHNIFEFQHQYFSTESFTFSDLKMQNLQS